jgi:hypothetical protein
MTIHRQVVFFHELPPFFHGFGFGLCHPVLPSLFFFFFKLLKRKKK